MNKAEHYKSNLVTGIALLLLFAGAFVLKDISGSFIKLKLVPGIWQCCYLVILATSLNLTLGYLGQLSLGHCGFMAIGAYTASLLSLGMERAGLFEEKSGFAYILIIFACIVAGGLLASVFGVLVGIPALRLKGDYLAIITLGFGLIVINVINCLPFAGHEGLSLGSASNMLTETGLGFGSSKKVEFLWVGVLVTILCVVGMYTFIRSKMGRSICAIRDNEVAASSCGLNVSFFKVMTFAYSAFFAGIAGGLYSCTMSTLDTSVFGFANGSILNSTFIVVMVVLGGMGSLTGSIVAAVVMFFLDYQIKNGSWVGELPAFAQSIFKFPMLVYAILLIIIIMFRPRGIFGTHEFSLYKTLKAIPKLFRKKATKEGKENG